MYPILCDEISVYEVETPEGTCRVIENAKGEEFWFKEEVNDILLSLDGTRPLPYSREIVECMQKDGLIYAKRFIWKGLRSKLFLPVWNVKKEKRAPFILLNKALPLLAVLVFLYGLVCAHRIDIDADTSTATIYLCMLVSIVLHEWGHMIAGTAYGSRTLSSCLSLQGAQTGFTNNPDSKKQRIQMSLAGLEMNMLIAGLCFIICGTLHGSASRLVAVTGVINTVLIFPNLIPSNGSDGECVFSELLGVDSIFDLAKSIVTDRKKRRKSLRSGWKGHLGMLFMLSVYPGFVFWYILYFRISIPIIARLM